MGAAHRAAASSARPCGRRSTTAKVTVEIFESVTARARSASRASSARGDRERPARLVRSALKRAAVGAVDRRWRPVVRWALWCQSRPARGPALVPPVAPVEPLAPRVPPVRPGCAGRDRSRRSLAVRPARRAPRTAAPLGVVWLRARAEVREEARQQLVVAERGLRVLVVERPGAGVVARHVERACALPRAEQRRRAASPVLARSNSPTSDWMNALITYSRGAKL